MTGGCIQDVLLVPDISTNLLFVYQICHSGSTKIVEFSSHDVVIREFHDPDLVVPTSSVDPDSWLYQFDGFESPDGLGVSLVAHADSMRRLWHGHFGHVNYRYLQQMSTQVLMTELPQISHTDGVW